MIFQRVRLWLGFRHGRVLKRVDRCHVTFPTFHRVFLFFCNIMSRLLASPRTRLRLTRGIASSAVDSPFSAHLNSVFAPLQFPPELAKRILTHGSHKEAIHGHNGRLAFVGAYRSLTYSSLLTRTRPPRARIVLSSLHPWCSERITAQSRLRCTRFMRTQYICSR